MIYSVGDLGSSHNPKFLAAVFLQSAIFIHPIHRQVVDQCPRPRKSGGGMIERIKMIIRIHAIPLNQITTVASVVARISPTTSCTIERNILQRVSTSGAGGKDDSNI